jgi:hypothetical protein
MKSKIDKKNFKYQIHTNVGNVGRVPNVVKK